jgi:SMODS and SLOG-associating 2TM effector domain 1
MALFRHRKAKPIANNTFVTESAIELCTRVINGIKEKADHNKDESLFCFSLVVFATLTAPLFITLGEGIILGKIIPSVLSLTAAGATTWLQLRQPQRLWALYRTAQRQLEDQRTRYHYQIGEYKTVEEPDKLLAERVADITIKLHYSWLPLLPKPENLQGLDARISVSALNQHRANITIDNEQTV